jgi:hypothetical protein
MCAGRQGFERFCERLPLAAQSFAEDGNVDAVLGLLRGLADAPPHYKEVAARAAQRVAGSNATPVVLREIDATCAAVEGKELDDFVTIVQMLAVHAAPLLCDQLEISDNRKMRRILLDALPAAGPTLMPLVRARLKSSNWHTVRNFVLLVPRAGGTAAELEAVARHPNEKVRLEVVRAVRAMSVEEASMDVVTVLLTDPSQEVRQGARAILRGDVLGPRGIATLALLAANEEEPEELRRAALHALGRSPNDAAAQALLDAMQPRGLLESMAVTSLRDVAAGALRSSPARAAHRLFGEGLKSSVWRVRKACERAGKST